GRPGPVPAGPCAPGTKFSGPAGSGGSGDPGAKSHAERRWTASFAPRSWAAPDVGPIRARPTQDGSNRKRSTSTMNDRVFSTREAAPWCPPLFLYWKQRSFNKNSDHGIHSILSDSCHEKQIFSESGRRGASRCARPLARRVQLVIMALS